jgi:hypothetical protein
MGAERFITFTGPGDAAERFKDAVATAAYDHGHCGHSGTIADKTQFITVEPGPLDGVTNEEVVRAWLREALAGWGGPDAELAAAAADKYGPAGHIALADGRHVFFGWSPR